MESNGKPGYINVSEQSKNILQTKFNEEFFFQENKTIEITNTGENVQSYLIFQK